MFSEKFYYRGYVAEIFLSLPYSPPKWFEMDIVVVGVGVDPNLKRIAQKSEPGKSTNEYRVVTQQMTDYIKIMAHFSEKKWAEINFLPPTRRNP